MHDDVKQRITNDRDIQEMIRLYLEMKLQHVEDALDKCELMRCPQLELWYQRTREYWLSTARSIRWLISHIPGQRRRKRQN